MKKAIFTFLVLLCAVAVVNAQDLTSKKGVPILPQAGDYGIGINAIPFLDYAGDLFNGTANNATPFWGFKDNLAPMVISGKYFKDANTAYRINLRIGYNSFTEKHLTPEDGATDPTATVDDKLTMSQMDIAIGVGLEKRRGHGRVQGIYGAEAGLMFGSAKDKYTYGNDFTATTGTWWDFETDTYMTNATPRPTECKEGAIFGLGVRAFVGVEYFFAPCMSLGGEFGWGLGFYTQGKGKETYESWDGSAAKETEFEVGGSSMFHLDTDNWGGAINLNFYF